MIVIDASVWLSAFQVDESLHAASQAWMKAWQGEHDAFSVPAHFPAEIAGALGRQIADQQPLHQILQDMLDGPLFVIHPISISLGGLAARIALRSGIRGADSIYVALAQHLGYPLVTWDRQQLERGASFADTLTPAMALERMA